MRRVESSNYDRILGKKRDKYHRDKNHRIHQIWPRDFFLVLKLKLLLHGTRFESIEAIKESVMSLRLYRKDL